MCEEILITKWVRNSEWIEFNFNNASSTSEIFELGDILEIIKEGKQKGKDREIEK